MAESILIEKLIQFGMSRQEANIYLTLLENGEMTGYEVSKCTGISRSNVYNALSLLTEHGAAYVNEGSSVKYSAVRIESFCAERLRELEKVKDELVALAPKAKEQSEGYLTIEGCAHIETKIREMLSLATERVYFAAPAEFISDYADELNDMLDRNLKVVVISEDKPAGLKNDDLIVYKSTESNGDFLDGCEPFRIITDSEYAFTGEVKGSIGSGIYSKQKNFVRMMKEAVGNEIKLISLNKN